MHELETGLWHWEARHPDWEPSVSWHHTVVSSYAIDESDRLLLFDPLAVPDEVVELAADRETAIVLTCPWHERDAHGLVEQLGARVFVPPPDDGSPDVAWLEDTGRGHLFSAGDRKGAERHRLVDREPPRGHPG